MTQVCRPTHDGIWIARDVSSGLSASGRTEAEALAELRRLLSFKRAA